MQFTEFFWDYDGTLFDTYPRITRAFQRGARDLGIAIDLDRVMRLVKVSIRHAIITVAAEQGIDPALLHAGYQAHAHDEGYESMRPYEGAVSLLKAVTHGGGRNYLYTHSGDHTIKALEHYDINQYFADHVTASHNFPSKPAPDALLYLMGKHGLDASRCVMLGDRDIDVQAGLNAGMAGTLFDPDGYYDAMPIAYRFKSMQEIERAFIDGKT